MDGGLMFVLAAAAAAGGWLWWRSRSGEAEGHLRRICFGNQDQVDRLIDGEMRRASGLSRAEAARRAVERHRRDNR